MTGLGRQAHGETDRPKVIESITRHDEKGAELLSRKTPPRDAIEVDVDEHKIVNVARQHADEPDCQGRFDHGPGGRVDGEYPTAGDACQAHVGRGYQRTMDEKKQGGATDVFHRHIPAGSAAKPTTITEKTRNTTTRYAA